MINMTEPLNTKRSIIKPSKLQFLKTGVPLHGKEREDEKGKPEEPTSRKRKRVPKLLHPKAKNPVDLLEDTKCKVEYQLVSTEGPASSCTYTYKIDVLGSTFHCAGSSRKEAKNKAADLALRSFIQRKNNKIYECLARKAVDIADDEPLPVYIETSQILKLISDIREKEQSRAASGKKSKKRKLTPKDPVALMNELECESNIDHHFGKSKLGQAHQAVVTINGRSHSAKSSKMKKAVRNAAAKALLFEFQDKESRIRERAVRLVTNTQEGDELPQVEDDQLFKLIQLTHLDLGIVSENESSEGVADLKSAVSILREFFGSTLEMRCSEESNVGKADPEFLVTIKIGDGNYVALGQTREEAEGRAAQKALSDVGIPVFTEKLEAMSL